MPIASCKRLLVPLLLLLSTAGQAQDLQQNLDAFAGRLLTAIKNRNEAQAYLVTDKSIFIAGESLWFRAFLLNAASQRVYTKDKYLFVDLVNERDSVLATALLDAANQQLDGRLVLPASLPAGHYWLRGYTQQMIATDSLNSAVKPIYIIGSDGRPAHNMGVLKSSNAMAQKPVVRFYPEGGALMTRINTTVAFAIGTASGTPLAAQGTVRDDHNAVIARFTSNSLGLGKFEFTPSPYRKYTAYLNGIGADSSYPLPAFNARAGQLAVTGQSDGKLRLRVLLEDSIYKEDAVTYVVGISRDSLCFAGIGRGLYELDVSEQAFPHGIATFYLLDKNFGLLSTRSVYISGNDVQVQAATDQSRYSKRDKVAVTVSVADAAGHAVPALFAVAVADSALLDPGDSCATMTLNPLAALTNWDLARMPCLTPQDRDLLMLVRTPIWAFEKVAVPVPAATVDSLLFIKGSALDEKGAPAVNKTLTLFSGNGNGFFATDTTDANGRFLFAVSGYTDSTQFAIEARDAGGKPVKLTVVRDPIPFPRFTTPSSLKQYLAVTPTTIHRALRPYLDAAFANAGKSLPAVTVKSRRPAFTSVKRVSNSSIVISGDELDERRRLGDIVLSNGGLQLVLGFVLANGLTAMSAPGPDSEPLLMVDGVQMGTSSGIGNESPLLNTLNSMNPKDVEFIEVLKGSEGANYGVRGGNGVILVNMISSRRPQNFNSKGTNLQTFYARGGIAKSGAFPAVTYENAKARAAARFDSRSVVFWDGAVLRSTADETRLQFYTSDVPATYKVVISGITARGDVVYKTVAFSSK